MAITRFTTDDDVVDIRMNQMINEIEKDMSCEYVTSLTGASLIDYIKALPPGTHKAIQFQNATDMPTELGWYYADIYTHIDNSRYFYVRLYRLDASECEYTGRCVNGTFSGWFNGGYSQTYTELLNGWTLPWASYGLKISRSGTKVTIQGVLGLGTTTTSTIIAELPSWGYPKGRNVVITCDNLTTPASGERAYPPIKVAAMTVGTLIVQGANNLTTGSFSINASYEGIDI